MKVRESGMPEEKLWSSFFNTSDIFDSLKISDKLQTVVEIGCGYGTFTLPLAKRIKGRIYSFDIENEMIAHVEHKLQLAQISNVNLIKKDVLAEGTGLANDSVNYLMLFNLLHNPNPALFFQEAHRVLRPDGQLGVIHWRSDIDTPRGPSLSIRPKPEQIIEWANDNGFGPVNKTMFPSPYHFALLFKKA